jgi:hypothetical protein
MTLRQLFGLIFLVALYIKLFDLCWWFMEPPSAPWDGLDHIVINCLICSIVNLYTVIIEVAIIAIISLPLMWWDQWSLNRKLQRNSK